MVSNYMNYDRIYHELIDNAKVRNITGYYENHHILPKFDGGKNIKSNMVKLTAREHFIAHWLLYKIYNNSKSAFAFHMMTIIDNNQSQRRVNSKNFEYARKARSRFLSKSISGQNNPFFGKTHTKEVKEMLSERRKLWWKLNPNMRKIYGDRAALVNVGGLSDEHKKKIGEKSKGFIVLKNIDTGETIKISKLENYDNTKWLNLYEYHTIKGTRKDLTICEHCNKSMNKGNYVRWHGEKCKIKNNENNKN